MAPERNARLGFGSWVQYQVARHAADDTTALSFLAYFSSSITTSNGPPSLISTSTVRDL